MKNVYKILIWTISSIVTILTVGLLLTYFWISTEWKDHYTEFEMRIYGFQINESKKLPDNFYLAFDTVYPKQRNKTLRKRFLQTIWNFITKKSDALRNQRECSSVLATRFIHNQKYLGYHSMDSYIIAHGLINYTSEERCFDYIYNRPLTEDISYEYFSKPLKELTIDENIELLIRLEKPTFYRNNPERLKDRISEINKPNTQHKYKPN